MVPCFALVRALLILDGLKIEMGWNLAQDLSHADQELLGAVAGQAFAKDCGAWHIESREQRRSLMAPQAQCQGAAIP